MKLSAAFRSALEEQGYAPDGNVMRRVSGSIRSEVVTRPALFGRVTAPLPETLEILRLDRPERRRHETGDALFDGEVLVRGPTLLVAAILDRDARTKFQRFLRGGGGLSNRELTRKIDPEFSPASQIGVLEKAAALATDALAAMIDPLKVVAQNAIADPVPGVRLRLLERLALDHADESRARTAFLGALEDPDPACRLTAAMELGDAGLKTVKKLLQDPSQPALIRIRALHHLCDHLSTSAARAALDAAIEPVFRKAVAWEASRLQYEGRQPGACPPDVAASLAAFPARIAQRFFVEQLTDAAIAIEAASALGRIGTLDAVPPLRVAEENETARPDVREAARNAIGLIQARDPHAAPGQLTVTDDGGHLTLSDRGRLSEPDRRRK